MSVIQTYKGFKVVVPDPTGNGGKAINDNIKQVGDLIESLQAQITSLETTGDHDAVVALQSAVTTLQESIAAETTNRESAIETVNNELADKIGYV